MCQYNFIFVFLTPLNFPEGETSDLCFLTTEHCAPPEEGLGRL